MKIGFWNIRGLNQAPKHHGVLNLVKSHSLDIMGLMETKLKKPQLERLMHAKFSSWEQINNFDSHCGGRILVLWNPAMVAIDALARSPQSILCLIRCKVTSFTFIASFIYGYHTLNQRRELWLELANHPLTKPGLPWILLGDFNNILQARDKSIGAPVRPRDYVEFADFCDSKGLVDLPFTGCHHTWTNGRVWSKIDRAMANHDWFLADQPCQVTFEPPGVNSDHSPCLVSLSTPEPNRSKPFKFFNMWASHKDFLPLVSDTWQLEIQGTAQFALARKLKILKHPLKRLNSLHFSHIASRSKRANTHLKSVQLLLHDSPSDLDLQAQLKSLRKEASFLGEAERLFYAQQAHSLFLKEADKCTKYFHGLMKRTRKKNHIATVAKCNGTYTTSLNEVAHEFSSFYLELLGTPDTCLPLDPDILRSGPSISVEHSAALSSPVTHEEIKKALFSIGNEKSPGPDGYTALFFKSTWALTGDLFCNAISEFFRSGRLLKQLNHTIIALIPKSENASRVGDFRPIALCNVSYKVISKILAARLSSTLDSIIDKSQSAFVSGRSMIENIHLTQELLRKYQRKKQVPPGCMIKIDLRKAFDSIDWGFLRAMLLGLDFPPWFVDRTMECVTTASYSISINGSITPKFEGRKGLRQGDPLSPFLFVICLEYLSRSINVATTNPNFNFHAKCERERLTHLAFADDLILIARGDPYSVHTLYDCLTNFGSISGLRLNNLKSNIYSVGIPEHDLHSILAHTTIPVGLMPFRYLGIPVNSHRLSIMDYAPFLDRFSAYIENWSKSSLSHAGRAELIRTVLQGVACFWLSILPIPKGVLDRITSLCRNFLWGSKHCPVAWAEVCLPKSEGGLGFRDLGAWNTALLAKTIWDIQAKRDSLWVKWIHNRYLRHSSLWDRPPNRDDSPLIKHVFRTRDLLLGREGSPEAAITLMRSWVDGIRFSTTKAYDYFRAKGTPRPWARDVWHPSITPKHSFTIWLCAKGRLSTRDRLAFLGTDPGCSLCGQEPESLEHLFFACRFTSGIWNHIRDWVRIRRAMNTIPSALKWIKKEGRGTTHHSKLKRIALATTVYSIWNARNRKIFEHKTTTKVELTRKIQIHICKAMNAIYPDYVIE